MPKRQQKRIPSGIWIDLTPAASRALQDLLVTGFFGLNTSDVAEGLLREKLRELHAAGWFK